MQAAKSATGVNRHTFSWKLLTVVNQLHKVSALAAVARLAERCWGFLSDSFDHRFPTSQDLEYHSWEDLKQRRTSFTMSCVSLILTHVAPGNGHYFPFLFMSECGWPDFACFSYELFLHKLLLGQEDLVTGIFKCQQWRVGTILLSDLDIMKWWTSLHGRVTGITLFYPTVTLETGS